MMRGLQVALLEGGRLLEDAPLGLLGEVLGHAGLREGEEVFQGRQKRLLLALTETLPKLGLTFEAGAASKTRKEGRSGGLALLKVRLLLLAPKPSSSSLELLCSFGIIC